jgi:hypothetical protein
MMEIALICIPSHDGPRLEYVDLALCRARTREKAPAPHILDELRAAHLQDEANRG